MTYPKKKNPKLNKEVYNLRWLTAKFTTNKTYTTFADNIPIWEEVADWGVEVYYKDELVAVYSTKTSPMQSLLCWLEEIYRGETE